MTKTTKFKNTEIGLIPEDWHVKPIETVLDKIIDYRGKTPRKSDCGVKTLSARSVKNGHIDYSQAYHISEDTFKQWVVRGKPEIGDILMTTEGPLGVIAKLDRDDVAIAQRLLTLRVKPDILDNNFLMYYLMSKIGQHQLSSRATGTTVQGIKQSEFRKILIAVPPIIEQKKIGKIIVDLDSKIELLKKQNVTLEKLGQTIFKQWFVDFEFPNKENKPYESSGGKMIESELGEIPEGWENNPLKSIFKFIKGKKPIQISETKEDGFVAQILIENLDGKDPVYTNPNRLVNVEFNDPVMVMDGASSGRIEIGFEGALGSTLAKLSVEKKEYTSVLYYYLKYFEKDIKQNTTGTSIPHTDKNKVYNYFIAIPNDLSLITIFNNSSLKIINKIIGNKTLLKTLQKTRDLLLPKLISGQIRVPLEVKK